MDPNSSFDDTIQVDSEAEEANFYGFYDNRTHCSFGIMKKGKYQSYSDFFIELIDFVTAKHLTGYSCRVTRQRDRKVRYDSN